VDDRRTALLVAGVALVVVGLVTTTLARGALLAVSAGARLIAAARARPAGSTAADARARQPAVPGISFWRWSGTTGWGTTPWGVGARVMLLAALAGAIAPVHACSHEVPRWVGLVTALVVTTLSFVPAWVIERLTRPSHILPRRTDLSIVLPAAAIWIAATVATSVTADGRWALAAGVLLLVGGIAAGVLLTRRESVAGRRVRETPERDRSWRSSRRPRSEHG
jgi:hypothetical protein